MRARHLLLFLPLASGCQTGIGDLATTDLAPAAATDLGPSSMLDGDRSADLARGPDVDGAPPASEQLPPTGRADLDAWLAQGYYTRWRCEPEPHDARPPGPTDATASAPTRPWPGPVARASFPSAARR